ncbi:Hym1p [Cystobasidiomycetes sp. EMM_F5]
MAFWRSKTRSPSELVRALKDSIVRLDAGPPGNDARKKAMVNWAAATLRAPLLRHQSLPKHDATEDISKVLSQMKVLLYGDGESEPQPELNAQLAQEFYSNDTFLLLLDNIWRFEFEARKDVSQVFNHLLRRQIGTRHPTVEYLNGRPDVVLSALRGYENSETALNTGAILHEMLRHETLAKKVLYSENLYSFIDYIDKTTFGIACDAMTNFKELLTRHKPLVAEFLDNNYDRFFQNFNLLITSPNYVTQRQSLRLLSELLLDRANFTVMSRYISSEENLKTIMNLLRSKAKNISVEAFHVFKIFVANPRKPPPIESILRRNKAKLTTFLRGFNPDREDEQFADEKVFLLQQIEAL